MKLNITISDPESGEVFEDILADMSDSPSPDDAFEGARWLIDLIESRVDCEEAP